MIELSVLIVSVLKFALGIAEADRLGASAKVQAACLLLGSRDRGIANASPLGLFHEGNAR